MIVATVTPDYVFPSTASLVQDALGASNAGAFDLERGLLRVHLRAERGGRRRRAGGSQHVLVIGAETFRASSTGPIATPACCSAMARARWW